MPKSAPNPYRLLPAVEEVLSSEALAPLLERQPREQVARFVGQVLDHWRAEIKAGDLDADTLEARLGEGALVRQTAQRFEREAKSGLRRVVNAAGVVLHTGLGRAPIHPDAAAAMERAARTYGTLEVDRFSGQRNQRDERLGELLVRLTGAEAGIAVNNCAAAMLLLLNTFSHGRETIVSRGELVEIGGSFRMPDVMSRAGAQLVEAGTTNRTRAKDFASAASERTGLLLKVHTSNFRVVGFTEEISVTELADLGQEFGIRTAFDLGSGRLEADGTPLAALADEPSVQAAVRSGVDVVCFSGDKLLGGPQAGLIVGRREAIRELRANPIYRAVRLDKVTIAGLESTLGLYLAGRAAEVPSRRMLELTLEELRPVAERLARSLSALGEFEAQVVEDASQPGSGSAPDVLLPSPVVRLRSGLRSAEALAKALRHGEPAVFARIQADELVLDPRTLLSGDEERLLTAFAALVASGDGDTTRAGA